MQHMPAKMELTRLDFVSNELEMSYSIAVFDLTH